MPRVNVEDRAWEHPRLKYAGGLMRLPWASLGWHLGRVWSVVTACGDRVQPRGLVAKALGVRPERLDGLVRAGLAADAPDDSLDLEPLRELFGGYEWYQELQGTASAGGRARATLADREAGQFQPAADWERDLPEVLSHLGPATAGQVADELNCSPKTARRHLQRLVREGVVHMYGRSRYTLDGSRDTEGHGHGTRRDTDTGHGGTRTRDTVPCPTSAPAPARAPAPAGVSPSYKGDQARAREGHGTRDTDTVSEGQSRDTDTGHGDLVFRVLDALPDERVEATRSRYQGLYEHYLAERDRVGASDKVRDPGPIDGPKQVRDILHRDGFANYRAGERDDELRSAVTLVAELGAAARDRGEARPWRLYAQLWHSRDTLRIALDDVAAGRDPRATFKVKTARPRRGGSVAVSTDEEFAEMEREIARSQGEWTQERAT